MTQYVNINTVKFELNTSPTMPIDLSYIICFRFEKLAIHFT